MKRMIGIVALVSLLTAGAALCRTWEIQTDGSGDAPNIQAGIDSAAVGDTVLVHLGTYNEHDIQMKSGIVLISQYWAVESTIVDAGGLGRVLVCDGVDDTAAIVALTLTGGRASGSGLDACGGGIALMNSSAPDLDNCIIKGNTADDTGGGVYCHQSSPYMVDCLIAENQATTAGGGLACRAYSSPFVIYGTIRGNTTSNDGAGAFFSDNSSPSFVSCTFLNNSAPGLGGGIYTHLNSTPTFNRCVIAFSFDGEAAYVYDDNCVPEFECSDIYGNEGGDWIGRIASQDNTVGNFSADPLYCDTLSAYLGFETCSPCVYGNHPWYDYCTAHIGMGGPACDCGEATEPTTWGAIKSMYR